MKNRGYVQKDKATGKWFARITVTDSQGRRVNIRRVAGSKGEASNILKNLVRSLENAKESASGEFLDGIKRDKITFVQLANAYKSFKVKPAEYRNDRKIAGLRSERTVSIRIDALLDYFGSMKLSAITVAEIERFKQKRLNTPTKFKTERSITSVNREVETLRGMLRFAVNEGWIDISPFERCSTPLISKADEKPRTRVLSTDEQERLLAVCAPHLKPLIICALHTGCRRGELLALTWNDIDFESRQITIRALTSKTLTQRVLKMSGKLYDELQELYSKHQSRELVFGITTKFQHSWDTACKKAEIEDLHFHDLRATFCTRLIEAGMPIEQVSKLSGHSQLSTLYKHYLSSTAAALDKAVELLDKM
jgi:integrase